MTSLTDQAKQQLSSSVDIGDIAIDATAGNGYDTLFLAQQVGPSGHVYAFDIQQQAIDNTQLKLKQNALAKRVTLIKAGHEHLQQYIATAHQQRITAIMFNLGYLPGSDKSCITRAESTLPALQQSLHLLKPKGILSVMLYPGHAGGRQETDSVLKWAENLPRQWQASTTSTSGPTWLVIQSIARR